MNIDNSMALNAYNAVNDKLITQNRPRFDEKALREQTDAFESFLVKTVLDLSIKNENPLFPKDAGDKIYNSMYNDTMSKALSGGFGFSDMLFNFLKERS
ncbi:MAG: rod-binding protein [Campylobacter sputorum]|uniref:rod-binding protein n=1 Tax=Campylobacter sputorum TaxID=206 RepID=UPI000B7823BC|nr:rod-binding protein [Campylobacter sputorum]ASM36925.1 putative flagellar protein FlgJ [Campylobacter sputorum bv. faecalis CCUG 20703]ASM38606.1 putative flagellar protein FlgJ [Campylobacter sputorum bv. paraureolyticus LMG 11764]MDY6120832.1 rod-binding protein [Campylobacter sputorum]